MSEARHSAAAGLAQRLDRRHGLEIIESPGRGMPVVLLHSNSTAAELYDGVLQSELGKRYHLLALSFPGHGRSRPLEAGSDAYSIPALASALVDCLGDIAPGPCVVVGHSLGGHVATTALARLPGVRGVMLISAPPLQASALGQIFRPDPTGGALFQGELSEGDTAAMVDALLAPGQVSNAFRQRVRDSIRRTDPRFRPALGRSIGRGMLSDEVSLLASTSVPTALIYGTDDRFIDTSYYVQVRLRTPWRQGLYSFPGSGHSPHWDAPQQFHALLETFLDDCLGR
jgi:pimeloyl-ACP methyl ester carboxylesterase